MDDNKVDIRYVSSSSQFIHCGAYEIDGKFKFWLTAIYAHNKMEQRNHLWKDSEDIRRNQQGTWCVIGEYNNVANSHDKIGGGSSH